MPAEFQQPGYLHVLINHLPIIGTAGRLFGLVIALPLRNRIALIPTLAIIVLSGVSAWPGYVTCSNAYRPIMKISDEAGRDWLNEHTDRTDQTIWVFYVMAGVAAIAIAAPIRWPKSAMPLGIAAALAALADLAVISRRRAASFVMRSFAFPVSRRRPGISESLCIFINFS
jgi:hypothetical protein